MLAICRIKETKEEMTVFIENKDLANFPLIKDHKVGYLIKLFFHLWLQL